MKKGRGGRFAPSRPSGLLPILPRAGVPWAVAPRAASPAARSAPKLMEMAQEAYQEVVARNPDYVEWQGGHPQLGVVEGFAAAHRD